MSKYFKILCILGLFLAGTAPALANTTLYGRITADTELTAEGSPYVVSATSTPLHIDAGATLTLGPGVEITGDIIADGNLVVAGATSSPVIINGTVVAEGSPTTTINNAVINGAMLIFGAPVETFNMVINSIPTGFNGGWPVYVYGGNFIHASTTITGNSTEKGFVVSLSGMTQGQTWTNDNGIPYIIETSDGLPSGISLIIRPGVVVKVKQVVPGLDPVGNNGSIHIQGGASSPVYVTSIKDDSVGGDTNNDGSATSPAPGDWDGLRNMGNGSMVLDNAVISYGTHALNGSNFTGSNIRISSSLNAALSTSHSTFDNVELLHNGTDISGCDHLTTHNSTIMGNGRGVECGYFASSTLTNNWWGDASGPYNATFNPSGLGDSVEGDLSLYYPWIGASPACSTNCNSNVMFLPGIEGSKLYDSNNSEVWLPGDDSVADTLTLSSNGSSTDPDITTFDAIKEGGFGQVGFNIYKTFLSDMETWQTTYGIIATTTPYDWRLDYHILLTNGRKLANGHITYLQPPAPGHDPYIIETLKQLASSSPTGKVTIIAHSNGGLLAKALTSALGTTTASQLIDKIVMVAAPQLGTPQAVGALLHGYKTGIRNAVSDAEGRKLAQNMPSAYNLLPSNQYFTYADDPVVTFNSTLPDWIAAYTQAGNPGAGIHSVELLRNFMTDTGRTAPAYSDTATPAVVSPTLFDNAQQVHNTLDDWIPPPGVQLITIAGWGNETLSGIEYTKEANGCSVAGPNGCAVPTYGDQITYNPKITIDGDGTVVEPSALWANGATSMRYWVNLDKYNRFLWFSTPDLWRKSHANILEVPQLRDLLAGIITNASTSTLPDYITAAQPTYGGDTPRLHFILHSPLTLGFVDASGNYTGSTATTTVFNAPGVDYERFGEVQWLSVPAGMAGQVAMRGTGSGSFALDIESVNGNDVLATTTFAAMPVSTSTVATLALTTAGSPTASSTLSVDSDGDGTIDFSVQAKQGSIVLPPSQEDMCKHGMPPHARPHMPKLPDFLAIFRDSKNNDALHNKHPIPPGHECRPDKIKTPPFLAE